MMTPTEQLLEQTLREHIETFIRYKDHGIEPGSCSRAILENNLCDAARRADHPTRFLLAHLALFVFQEMPGNCWGSKEQVDAWIKAHREARKA